jgi:hypothetical protein
VIPSAEAVAWLQALLALRQEPTENLAHCLVMLAQYTGDRSRDVPEEVRDQVAGWLDHLPDPHRLRELLTNPDSAAHQQEQDWILGEALPAGLVLSLSSEQQPV